VILLDEYFQDSITHYAFEPTMEDRVRCLDLLERAAKLSEDFAADTGHAEPAMTSGHRCRAKTLALIAEGYRAAVGGQHEQSNAIDLADAGEHLETWLTDERLEAYGLWREAPGATVGWVHVQRVPPHSGHRTFQP
jgi:hypothetical protein